LSKKYLFSLLFLVIFSRITIFANELEGREYTAEFESHVIFYRDTLEYVTFFKDLNRSIQHKKYIYSYTIRYEHNVPYLLLNGGKEKWLILFSDELLFLYNSKSDKPFFNGVSVRSGISLERIISPDEIRATSALIENGKEYSPRNISSDFLGKPWVEGVKGNGIGEKIFINGPVLVKDIYIANGYVSFSRPDLYTKNSRVKKIKILDIKNGIELIKELRDTPCPQRISFPDSKVRSIEIEILEVYEGTKYKDTCVNFIIFGA